MYSPFDRNEDHMLELPLTWEPLDSKRPLPDGEGKKARLSFSYRDQIT